MVLYYKLSLYYLNTLLYILIYILIAQYFSVNTSHVNINSENILPLTEHKEKLYLIKTTCMQEFGRSQGFYCRILRTNTVLRCVTGSVSAV